MSVKSVFIDAPVALLQLFGSREVAFSIAYGILGAAVLLGWLTFTRHRRFARGMAHAAQQAQAALNRSGATAAERLAGVDVGLRDGGLGLLWRPYRAAVERSPLHADELVNLVSPYEWFGLERLPWRGYERWASAWPGVFLTVGLLFTFIGLAAALLQVGDIGGGGTDMIAATDAVLRISSAKFVTSIAGLMSYIGWTLAARWIAASQAQAAQRLAAALQGLSTPLQPEALLFLTARQLGLQTARLEAAPGATAAAIDGKLDVRLTALSRGMAESGQALVKAFEDATARLGKVNEDAVGRMAAQLGNDLRLSAGAEMRAVVAALREATGEFTQARTGIAQAGAQLHRELAAAADAIRDSATVVDVAISGGARSFGETLAKSVGRAAADLAQAGRDGGEALRTAAGQTGAKLSEALDAAGRGLASKVQASAVRLEGASEAVGRRLDAVGSDIGQVEAAIGEQVRQLARTADAVAMAAEEMGKASQLVRGAVRPVSAALRSADAAAIASQALLAQAERVMAALGAAAHALQAAAGAGERTVELQLGRLSGALDALVQEARGVQPVSGLPVPGLPVSGLPAESGRTEAAE